MRDEAVGRSGFRDRFDIERYYGLCHHCGRPSDCCPCNRPDIEPDWEKLAEEARKAGKVVDPEIPF